MFPTRAVFRENGKGLQNIAYQSSYVEGRVYSARPRATMGAFRGSGGRSRRRWAPSEVLWESRIGRPAGKGGGEIDANICDACRASPHGTPGPSSKEASNIASHGRSAVLMLQLDNVVKHYRVGD